MAQFGGYITGQILVGLVIAVVTAVVTVKLAFRRFRSERWWEKKAEAYSKIVEALHHMKRYYMEEIAAYEKGTRLDEARQTELGGRLKEGVDAIKLAADVGTSLISDEAVECIEKLHKGLSEVSTEEDWYGYIDAKCAEVESCLKTMRSVARRDLRVK